MLTDLLIRRVTRRAPDFVIGGEADPYMRRWWVIPRNRWFNIYLHEVLRDDDDRALHDHPWVNCSIVLRGGYVEVTRKHPAGIARAPGTMVFRLARELHRLKVHREIDGTVIPCWSLFITGPVVRSWGFQCPQGWVHWRKFTAGKNGETVGKGCDQ